MIIKKGQKLQINHSRMGRFLAIASKDFDPDTDNFNIYVAPGNGPVFGASSTWIEGEWIPCRKSLVRSFKVLN